MKIFNKIILFILFSFYLNLVFAAPPHTTWRFVTESPTQIIMYRDTPITIFTHGFLTRTAGAVGDMLEHVDNPSTNPNRPDPFIGTTTDINFLLDRFVQQRVLNWRTLQHGAIVGYIYEIRNFMGSNYAGSWSTADSLNAIAVAAAKAGKASYSRKVSSVIEDYADEAEWAFWGPIYANVIRNARPVIFDRIINAGTLEERPVFILGDAVIPNPAFVEDETSHGHPDPYPPYLPPGPGDSDSDDDDDYGYALSSKKPYISPSFCNPYGYQSYSLSSIKADAKNDLCLQAPTKVRLFNHNNLTMIMFLLQ